MTPSSIFSDRINMIYLIFFYSAALAAGFIYFIDPHNIVPGGVYGICIVVKNITSEMMGNGI